MGDSARASPPALLALSAEATAAALRLAGGRKLLLLSAPGAAGTLGPEGWRALVARVAALAPGTPFAEALCCAAAPGLALAALRAGCRTLVLDGGCPGFPQLAGAAAEAGAVLWPARPPALDLRGLRLDRPGGRARLAAWLAAAPHDIALPSG